jgi:hypothetical protein
MISAGKPQGHGWCRYFSPQRAALEALYAAAARRRAQERKGFERLIHKPQLPRLRPELRPELERKQ